MTGKYNEVMGRLELSDEAKARILSNVTERAETDTPRQGKVIPFSGIRRYAAVAACLAVVMLAVFALPRLQQDPNGPSDVASNGGIQECESADALAAAVGFPVEELSNLPFVQEEVCYAVYFGEMAQITYGSSDTSVTLRKARGNEDISGDFNEYSSVSELKIDTVPVTLKGDGDTCSLALWQREGFSYSLSIDPGISEQEITMLINDLLNQ
ncbi:MAG: hypothetical protein J6N19_18110 [Clostridium sp.]|nr:hypothetical protein [Clostridium sp.]